MPVVDAATEQADLFQRCFFGDSPPGNSGSTVYSEKVEQPM